MNCGRPAFTGSIIAMSMCLLWGCSDSDSPTGTMPLAIGNTWTYALIERGTPRDDLTLTITSTENAGGHRYFFTNTDLAFAWTSDGLSLATLDPFDATPELEVLLREPPPVDPYDYTSSWAPTNDWYVVPSQEEIVVPAGHFNATTYRLLTGDTHLFRFSMSFADGVGMVRLVNSLGDAWLLKSYELAGSRPGPPF